MNELVGLLRTETHCCYHLLHSTRLHCYSLVLLGVHPFVSPGAHTPPPKWTWGPQEDVVPGVAQPGVPVGWWGEGLGVGMDIKC